MNRETVKKEHQNRISVLMGKTIVDSSTAFDVLDEATVHLIDNFNPPDNQAAKFDNVMIIGSAYLGTDRNNDEHYIRACSFFQAGDMHELSHTIADVMHSDKKFAQMIFHAMEVFALHEKRTPDF